MLKAMRESDSCGNWVLDYLEKGDPGIKEVKQRTDKIRTSAMNLQGRWWSRRILNAIHPMEIPR